MLDLSELKGADPVGAKDLRHLIQVTPAMEVDDPLLKEETQRSHRPGSLALAPSTIGERDLLLIADSLGEVLQARRGSHLVRLVRRSDLPRLTEGTKGSGLSVLNKQGEESPGMQGVRESPMMHGLGPVRLPPVQEGLEAELKQQLWPLLWLQQDLL